jgi:Domain of unknown function (DUF1772)
MDKAESMAATSLEDTSAEAGVAKEETTHALVDRWGTLNLARAVVPLVASVLGAWATLNPVEVVGFEFLGVTTGAERIS